MYYPDRTARIWLLALLGLAAPALALVTDRDQPIEIESDSAEFHEADGTTLYQGNVRLTQGSILLQADRITLRSTAGQISVLIAEGTPANYVQTVNDQGERVIAESNYMEYQLNEGVLTLTEDARLTQQGTTLSGNQIVYDVQRHVLRASALGETRQDRVRVTIPAAAMPESDNAP